MQPNPSPEEFSENQAWLRSRIKRDGVSTDGPADLRRLVARQRIGNLDFQRVTPQDEPLLATAACPVAPTHTIEISLVAGGHPPFELALHCTSGCDPADVLRALHKTGEDLGIDRYIQTSGEALVKAGLIEPFVNTTLGECAAHWNPKRATFTKYVQAVWATIWRNDLGLVRDVVAAKRRALTGGEGPEGEVAARLGNARSTADVEGEAIAKADAGGLIHRALQVPGLPEELRDAILDAVSRGNQDALDQLAETIATSKDLRVVAWRRRVNETLRQEYEKG